MRFYLGAVLLAAFVLVSCASSKKMGSGNQSSQGLAANGLEFMVWNVENLFDYNHDEGKNDWAFVPIGTPGKAAACEKVKSFKWRRECFETDWNADKLSIKMDQIKEVIWRDRFRMPNFFALVEVENKNVVSKLAKHLGYENFVMSEGPDYRGIDMAVLYRGEGINSFQQNNFRLRVKNSLRRTDQHEISLRPSLN